MLKKQSFFLLIIASTCSLAMNSDSTLKRKRDHDEVAQVKKIRPNISDEDRIILSHPNFQQLVESLNQLTNCEALLHQNTTTYHSLRHEVLVELTSTLKTEKQKLLNVAITNVALLHGQRNRLIRDCEDHINTIFAFSNRPTIAEAKEIITHLLKSQS